MDSSDALLGVEEAIRLLESLLDAQLSSGCSFRSPLVQVMLDLLATLRRLAHHLGPRDDNISKPCTIQRLFRVLYEASPILRLHLDTIKSAKTPNHEHGNLISAALSSVSRIQETDIGRSISKITADLYFVLSFLINERDLSRLRDGVDDSEQPYCPGDNHPCIRRRSVQTTESYNDNSDQHIRFCSFDAASTVELPGCLSFRLEQPLPISVEEQPMTVSTNTRADRVAHSCPFQGSATVATGDCCLAERSTLRLQPLVNELLVTCPPAYTPASHNVRKSNDDNIVDFDSAIDVAITTPTPSHTLVKSSTEHESFINPITAACRDVMRSWFPSPTTSLFDDYAQYRDHVRNKQDYRWFLNFRYMSFVLQVDLPFEIFLVKVKRYQSETREDIVALIYLLENSIVFARFPLRSYLPDPNASQMIGAAGDESSDILDSGLMVLEDLTIRFASLVSVYKDGKKALVIDVTDDGKPMHLLGAHSSDLSTTKLIRYELCFKTSCQRRKVAQSLKAWMLQSNERFHSQHGETELIFGDVGRESQRPRVTNQARYDHSASSNLADRLRPRDFDFDHQKSHFATQRAQNYKNGNDNNILRDLDVIIPRSLSASTPELSSHTKLTPRQLRSVSEETELFDDSDWSNVVSSSSCSDPIYASHFHCLKDVWLDE